MPTPEGELKPHSLLVQRLGDGSCLDSSLCYLNHKSFQEGKEGRERSCEPSGRQEFSDM